jgi:hypothetical protein
MHKTTGTILLILLISLALFNLEPFRNLQTVTATGIDIINTIQLKLHSTDSPYNMGGTFAQNYGLSQQFSDVKATSTGAGIGQMYVFFVVNRTWLNGRILNWGWSGYAPFGSNYWWYSIYDGSYDRSSDSDFPYGSGIPLKGAGILQSAGSPNTDEFRAGPVATEITVNVASGNQANCTVFFCVRDGNSNEYRTMQIYWIFISQTDGGYLAEPVTMEHTGTNHDYGYTSPSLDFSATWTIQDTIDHINWTYSLDTIYAGSSLGKTTLQQLKNAVDVLPNSSWMVILDWEVTLRQYGLNNETTIKRALDGSSMLANGLPDTEGGGYSVYYRNLLWGYWWASQYSYQTAKWDIVKAEASFKTAIDAANMPRLVIYGDNSSWMIAYGPRYYDETAQTIDVFLEFYQMGITSALTDALTWWGWMNDNLWVVTPPHYDYALAYAGYECEAGGMEEIVWKLYALNGSLTNIDRMFTDADTRFLTSLWGSPQWTAYYCIHHNPENSQRRLRNTIMSWAAILGLYNNMTNSVTIANVQKMLNGSAVGLYPAWSLLTSTGAGIYNSSSHLFKMMSSDAADSMDASALAVALMLVTSVSPISGSVGVPINEGHYEYTRNIIDSALWKIDFTSHTMTYPVMNGGTFRFMLGNYPFSYNLSASGLWNLTFTSDWNNITSAVRISDLPSRIYLGTVGSADYPILSVTITSNDTVVQTGDGVQFNDTVLGGTPPFNYQWIMNGSNVGTNSSSYVWTAPAVSQNTTYAFLLNVSSVGSFCLSNTIYVLVVWSEPPITVTFYKVKNSLTFSVNGSSKANATEVQYALGTVLILQGSGWDRYYGFANFTLSYGGTLNSNPSSHTVTHEDNYSIWLYDKWSPSYYPPDIPTTPAALQYLVNGDYLGFINSYYTSQIGELFYAFIMLICYVGLYLRLKSIVIPLIAWTLMGGFWIRMAPSVSPFVALFWIIGIGGGALFAVFSRGSEN